MVFIQQKSWIRLSEGFSPSPKYPNVFKTIDAIKKLKRWDGKDCPEPSADDIKCFCCNTNGKYWHPTEDGQRPEIWLCYDSIDRNGTELTLDQADFTRTLWHELTHWRHNCPREYVKPRVLNFEYDVLDETIAHWETGSCDLAQDKEACLEDKVRLSLYNRYKDKLLDQDELKRMRRIIRNYLEEQRAIQ